MVVSDEARSRLGSSTERSGVVAAEDEGGDAGGREGSMGVAGTTRTAGESMKNEGRV